MVSLKTRLFHYTDYNNFEQMVAHGAVPDVTKFYINGKLQSGVSLTRNKNLAHRLNIASVKIHFDYDHLRKMGNLFPVHSNNKMAEMKYIEQVRSDVIKENRRVRYAEINTKSPSLNDAQIKNQILNEESISGYMHGIEIQVLKRGNFSLVSYSSDHKSKHVDSDMKKECWAEEFHVSKIPLNSSSVAMVEVAQSQQYAEQQKKQGQQLSIEDWCSNQIISFGSLKI